MNLPKCPDCGGEKEILCHANRDGECTWDRCPQGYDINTHCRLDVLNDEESDIPPCPTCIHPDTQEPCGYLIPEMVERCPMCKTGTPTKERPWMRQNCNNCGRTGYVPRSEAEQIKAMLEHPDFVRLECNALSVYDADWSGCTADGETPYQALLAAVEAATEAER